MTALVLPEPFASAPASAHNVGTAATPGQSYVWHIVEVS